MDLLRAIKHALWFVASSRSKPWLWWDLCPSGPYDHYAHSSCCDLCLPLVYVSAWCSEHISQWWVAWGGLHTVSSKVLCSWWHGLWYVSNISIVFDAPCLFLHHLPNVSLHFMAFLCDFWN
jgi:hypothetical protein